MKKTIFSILALILSLWSPVLKANDNSLEVLMSDHFNQFKIESEQIEQLKIYLFNKSNRAEVPRDNRQIPLEIPKNYHDAIIDHDIPVEAIQTLSNLSFDHWSNKVFSDEEKTLQKTYNLDLNTLKESNIQAYKFWNKLVACNRNNADLARLHFIMAIEDIDLCENESGEIDTVRSVELLNELKIIKTNFQSFYTDINLNFTHSLKNKVSYNLFYNLFQNLHPILVQFLVMQSSVLTYAYYEELIHRVSIAISEIQSSLFTYNSQSETQQLNNDKEILLKWTLNSNTILSLVNYKNFENSCETFGLWPILNRTLFAQQNMRINPNLIIHSEAYTCENRLNHTVAWFHHRNFMSVLNYKLSNWDNRSDGEKKLAQISDTAVQLIEPIAEPLHETACPFPGLNIVPNIIDNVHYLFDPERTGGGYLCH